MKDKYASIRTFFEENDPLIYPYVKQIDYDVWFARRPRDGDHPYFHALCRAIIGQQLSGKAADTIYGRFRDLVGAVSPETIRAIEDQELRDAGMSLGKISYINDLAGKVSSKEIELESLEALSDTEVIKELTSVKGIGEWTAEMFLMFTLNRDDIFSYGDLGLKNGFAKVYKIENPTKVDIQPIIDTWSPYKTYGSIALWVSLDS